MDAPGTGNFLANEFRRLLGTDGLKIRVAPLTMMTIEDLENLESSINAFSMRQLLFDYTNDVPHGLLSLRNYIARSAYAEKLKPSPFLRTKSEELLIHARKVLFPNTEIRIRERAYMLWAQQGRPDGKHLEHWLQAETEIEADKTSEEIA